MPFANRHEEQYLFKENDQKDRGEIYNRKTGPIHLDHQKRVKGKKIALIGWGIPSIEAMQRLDRDFIVVSLPEFKTFADKHNIPFVAWDFGKDVPYNDVYKQSEELYQILKDLDVDHTVPIFEETVEWAGALNSRFRNEPRLFDHAILFRDKAMMKRRAHIGGLRVGIFEEAKDKEDVRRFFNRVNGALLRTRGEEPAPIHVKAFNKAGASGHRMIMSEEDIESKLSEENFPSLLESHLQGLEISCEAFIHNGKVQFLNVTEYVVFGYSMMVPPTKEIEKLRPQIRKEVEKIVDVFNIQCGLIHPEFFISDEEELYFGEMAYRIPGGHIFDLMRKTYNFNPYEAHLLCCDPNTTEEEIKDIFPDETEANGHAGSFLVYPKKNHIHQVNMPKELEEHDYFDKHTLFKPAVSKIQSNQEGYGNHLGTIFFYGDDGYQVKQLLSDYVDHHFYM
ncbi:carboxylate--amine ligase [Gracilibacillus caseinilyticus]|uniref:Carboxylate--amine ligase n=1 Tax=Gracilibacillus caseinilyticus TaxID=2932256 RepID=A0ABY4EYF9_9BACI|nr:carboxylate--amine ligase [Gracilibacillus caseinilyticus]UOQ49051.1 carboxylate--amine ligase [Gracilibacillus caseinilyticus]